MFEISEDFFISLGMPKMVDDFYKSSTFSDTGKKMVCHASAWDFLDKKDLNDSRYRWVQHFNIGEIKI